MRNAINFTKEGTIANPKKKKIEVGSVIISIEDTGTGIDPEILPRLFTKFTKKSAKGTGLGLYISKSIVEALVPISALLTDTRNSLFCFEIKRRITNIALIGLVDIFNCSYASSEIQERESCFSSK